MYIVLFQSLHSKELTKVAETAALSNHYSTIKQTCPLTILLNTPQVVAVKTKPQLHTKSKLALTCLATMFLVSTNIQRNIINNNYRNQYQHTNLHQMVLGLIGFLYYLLIVEC